ncbi:MAG: thiamine-phosphate kinase [Rhodospirillales bacterium]|nr:thiamine-phosphate kinase [Rhodospirillales bacterium]
MAPGLGEFELIARFFAPLAAGRPGALGLLDDAALIEERPGWSLVATTDTIVAGVHFPVDAAPADVACRLLGVNLSDLAAMGAEPAAYLLALGLPQGWRDAEAESWLEGFAGGLAAGQREHTIALVGGDTVASPGPLTLTLTALGHVEAGQALLRSGARPGERVYVSGSIGDAALGLRLLEGRLAGLGAAERAFLLDRYRRPRPRLALGRRLCRLAGAAADVSDGLVADLGHICTASGVGARIDAERVPLSEAAAAAIGSDPALLALALTGGDDYELVFTAGPSRDAEVAALAGELELPLTAIGEIVGLPSGGGMPVMVERRGAAMAIAAAGWQHRR